MPERPTACQLLERARALYDAPNNPLAERAKHAWRTGFSSGGQWMGEAIGLLRSRSALRCSSARLQRLGIAKYLLASASALACAFAVIAVRQFAFLPLSVFAFYAVEAQFVFLLPLALDGDPHPFWKSRAMVKESGGTLHAMRIVMLLATTMLFGGLFGRGFIRSWCLGCLAVCAWYEDLRHENPTPVSATAAAGQMVAA